MRACTLTLALAAFLSCSAPEEGTGVGVGDRIPSFSVTACDGSTVTGESLSRGCTVMGFFHTACPDCRSELDVLQEFWDRHSQEVSFILIGREEKAMDIARYWQAHGYSMPYSAQEDRRVYSLFGTTGVPLVYVASEGVVVAVFGDAPTATLCDLEQALSCAMYGRKAW